MADLTQTATSVKQGANAVTVPGTFGETVTAGNLCYKASADSKWYNALNDTAAHAGSLAIGMALNGGAVDQAATIQTEGYVYPGATVAVGEIYIVSVNAGKVAVFSDLGSGKQLTVFGYGYSTSQILIDSKATGIAKA